jgi:hypothetical protein
MNEDLFPDFFLSNINNAINAITRKQDISTFYDSVLAYRSNTLSDALSFTGQIQQNKLIEAGLILEFQNLLNVYVIYWQQTSGQKDLSVWLNESNSDPLFGSSATPKQFVNSRNPAWYQYEYSDDVGEVALLVNIGNVNSVGTSSATTYKKLRNVLSPQSVVVGGGTGGASPVLPGNQNVCINDTKYSFKVEQVLNPNQSTRQWYGFQINSAPRLSITFLKCCYKNANSSPIEVFNKTVPAKLFWEIVPCDGKSAEDGRKIYGEKDIPGSQRSIGKIHYSYYYDLRDIIFEISNGLSIPANPSDPNSKTYYDLLRDSLPYMTSGFVEEFGLTMCQLPFLTRKQNWLDTINSFAKIPMSLRNFNYGNFNWWADATKQENIGQSFLENFFLMASKNSNLQYNFNSIVSSLSTNLVANSQTPLSEINDDTRTSPTALLPAVGIGFRNATVEQCDNLNGSIDINKTEGIVERTAQVPGYGTVTLSANINPLDPCSNFENWYIEVDTSFPFSDNSVFEDYDIVKGKVTTIDATYVNANPLLHEYFVAQNSGNTARASGIRQFLTPFIPLRGWYGDRQAGVAPVVKLEGNPCLTGEKERWAWKLKRRRKAPYRLYCNTANGPVERSYRLGPNSNEYKFMLIELSKLGFSPARKSDGKLDTLTGQLYNGYFYTNVDIEQEVLDSGFDRYSNVTFSPSLECNYSEVPEYSWVVDSDNPCGCDEVEVLTNYIVFEDIEYKDPLTGEIVFKLTDSQKRMKDLRITAPLEGSFDARLGLKEGQRSTGNRREKLDCFGSTYDGKHRHPFLYGTDVLPGLRKRVIRGLFNTSQSLECYYTGSTQNISSKDYYYEITDCDSCKKTAYFAVAYGNKNGSGSLSSGYESNDSPSRAIYSQYRLLCLDPHESEFKFYNDGSVNTSDDVYVINFYRDGLSDKLDTGNFEINLAALSGSGKINIEHTGSKVQVSGSNPTILTLIDNSSQFDNEDSCAMDDPMYSYQIVSGSLNTGVDVSGLGTPLTNVDYTTYGLVYPNLGIIVLDGSKLNSYLTFNSVTGSNISGDNSWKIHTSISGAAYLGKPMKARNVRQKTTNHYFVRIPSADANYTTNPTYVYGPEYDLERGKIKNQCFVQNPTTYITTVGLYNNRQELLAIAKLSKPIKKTKENDVLIKIRLNW